MRTGLEQPAFAHSPDQVTRPAGEIASVTWPALQVPRVGTPIFGALVWTVIPAYASGEGE